MRLRGGGRVWVQKQGFARWLGQVTGARQGGWSGLTRDVHESLAPQARAAGWLTDNDILREVS